MEMNNILCKEKVKTIALSIIVTFFSVFGTAKAQIDKLNLWYEQPAQKWTQALPVGNGSLGGMIFGGVGRMRIQLNEESVWRGHTIERRNPSARAYLDSVRQLIFDERYVEAEKLAQQKIMGKRLETGKHTYQTLGDIHLDFGDSTGVSGYRRSLNLKTAVAQVQYAKKGVHYKREIFSSYPDQVMAIRLTADQARELSFELRLSRPGANEKVAIGDQGIVMREHVGKGDGVRYTARLRLDHTGGSVNSTDSTLQVSGADKVIILLTAATDYRGNPDNITQRRMQKAAGRSYQQLKQRHIKDYQRLFGRATLDLGGTKHEMPTDRRLSKLKAGGSDTHLTELYFQYGRYLLISSSRPGSLPANLQGIWARGMAPPWNADYHTNINLQMNYWPAALTNLAETAHPLFNFVEALNKRGQKTARQVYGARGTVVHHTTDAWHFTAPIGKTYYGLWPMGGAWLSMRFWEHYRFTQNQSFLRERAYPQLKKAATFFVDYLVEDPHTGKLVTGPSMSPENQFITPDGKRASVTMGPTMDMEIVDELFGATISASRLLDSDPAFRDTLRRMKGRLAPVQIGDNGTIMEWRKDFKEAEPGHRHISHLYSLYPGNAINANETPELFEAARKTIDRRLEHGGGHTGWSRAWIINFFARLKDGAKAQENLLALFQKSTLANLFDTHPPFQIDGNFGGTAGIAEMLLQSHAGYIELLPALPEAWPEGSVEGLRARGGLTVDVSWADDKLDEARIEADNKGVYKIKYQNKTIELEIPAGATEVVMRDSF